MKKIILSIALSFSTFSLLAQLDSAAFEVRNGGSESSFSVADLTSGIYFMTISTDHGIAQNKFIKE